MTWNDFGRGNNSFTEASFVFSFVKIKFRTGPFFLLLLLIDWKHWGVRVQLLVGIVGGT